MASGPRSRVKRGGMIAAKSLGKPQVPDHFLEIPGTLIREKGRKLLEFVSRPSRFLERFP